MNLTADGQAVMENKYRYDAVDNILGITNAANPTSLTKLNKAKLGGRSSHTYEYDELNRLIHASGKAKSASYDMVMSFGRMSEPLTKVQKVDSTTTAKSYNFAYKYEDSNHPTAPTQIGHDHYTYDANGNPTLVTNDSANTTREMYWDEDNRLMVLSDNGKTSRYTYNAAGERIMKSYGTMEGVYINGAPQGITFHETDNFTLYPASIISINKNRFTKHYFIGDKRVASRIGTGLFNNVYGRNGSYVTAGQQDYAEHMNQIQKQKEAYYKQQGIAPGVPTMKGAYGDPENTGVGYNSILTELGNHDVPQGWIQTPRPNTTPNTTPDPPVSWNDPSNPDDPQAGYGYIANDTTKEETFFYHSDHLGSTSYITDDHANITQYDAYLPYGELLVDEHSSSEDLPYKFNGKQFDDETGLYYYGARYLNPMASIWYGVDPLAEKYIDVSAYLYCYGNPIKMIDSNGKETHVALNKDGTYSVIGGKLNEDRNIYIYSKDKYGRYTIRGKSIGITTSVTSFYNSDKQKWAIGSTIDVRDNSGDKFLTSLITKKPSLFNDYMTNARTGHLYDFKYSNGTINTVDDGKDIYRGMPIGITGNGQTIFTSARDVGNIAAGYIAGINGMSWKASRTAFDAYQSKSSGKPTIEGLSTRNAENYGWRMGSNIKNYTPNQKATNLVQSINDGLKALGKYLYNRIKNIF